MKTRYIKYLALPLMLASAWSCTDMTEDAVNEVSGGSTVKEIVLLLPELKTADTRTEFTVDEVNKTLKTAWKEGDVAGIFPTTGYNQVEFPISDSWGESVARFDGGDWALRANKSYAAYFPFNKANFERDATSIILSYEGQVQSENGSVSHLSDYDYLATGAAQADAYGSIYFQMQRLSGIARFAFTLPADEAASFTKLVLLADEEVFDVKKSLDITGSIPQLGAAESSRSISMNLNNISADENHQLIVYMTLPPMSTNGQVKFNLMKDNGDLLIATSSGFSVEAGKVQGISISGFETMVNTTIEFEDNLVKTICVENWDMNGDGELGMAEAAVVTRLPNWQYSFNSYLSDTEITSFNELQYFTGLTSIADGAFDRCWYLESIVFPPSLLKIEHCAFRDCSSLTNVFFPESLTTIEGSAFESCVSLTEINLPASLTSLSNSFNGCSGVVSMTLGNSKYNLYDGTLIIEGNKTIGCLGNKTEVEIPDNITTIGEWSFISCSNLKEVIIPNSVTIIEDYAFHGGHGVRDITIPSSVTYIGSQCFADTYMNGITINAQTPPTLGDDNVFTNTNNCPIYVPANSVNAYKEAWSDYADRIMAINADPMDNFITFADANVKAVCVQHWDTNGDGELSYAEAAAVTDLRGFSGKSINTFDELQYFIGLTSISDWTFSECSNLTCITIPDGVTYIGIGAFYACRSLTSVTIPEGVATIGDEAFIGCKSLSRITIHNGLTSIGERVFRNCVSLISITIPKGVTNIGNEDFYGCSSLTSVIIPEGVTSIGNSAFYGCSNLTDVTIPEGLTSIEHFAFENCNSLSNITIPKSVTSIGNGAFEYCYSLSNITIPNGVTNIGNFVFDYCGLTSIIIPEGVTNIGLAAFYGCSNLTNITFTSIVPPTLEFNNYSYPSYWMPFPDDTILYVPSGYVETYKSAWPDYADKIKAIGT